MLKVKRPKFGGNETFSVVVSGEEDRNREPIKSVAAETKRQDERAERQEASNGSDCEVTCRCDTCPSADGEYREGQNQQKTLMTEISFDSRRLDCVDHMVATPNAPNPAMAGDGPVSAPIAGASSRPVRCSAWLGVAEFHRAGFDSKMEG